MINLFISDLRWELKNLPIESPISSRFEMGIYYWLENRLTRKGYSRWYSYIQKFTIMYCEIKLRKKYFTEIPFLNLFEYQKLKNIL